MSLLNRLPSSSSSLAQTSTPPGPSRPNPFSRPGTPPVPPRAASPAVQYSVVPPGETAVKFQLKGLGDPFYRLLGLPLNPEYGTPEKVAEALQRDSTLHQKLMRVLDEAWANYQFVGALLLSPYDTASRVYTAPLHPAPVPEDDSETPPTPAAPKCAVIRAIDLTLVLNVLARVRDGILVARTPLALEPAFLDKIWVTSDARLVTLASATGCLEDVWA